MISYTMSDTPVKVIINKTIEDMAEMGYVPVLDTAIVGIRIHEQTNILQTLASRGEAFKQMYQQRHLDSSPLPQQIEAIAVRLPIAVYDGDDNSGKYYGLGSPTAPIDENFREAFVSILPYIRKE